MKSVNFPAPLIVSLFAPGPWMVKLISVTWSGPLVNVMVPYALRANWMISPDVVDGAAERADAAVVVVGHGHDAAQQRSLLESVDLRSESCPRPTATAAPVLPAGVRPLTWMSILAR